jgi:hypothetical protein
VDCSRCEQSRRVDRRGRPAFHLLQSACAIARIPVQVTDVRFDLLLKVRGCAGVRYGYGQCSINPMKTLTLLGLGLLASAEAFGQATFNGQFNDQAPLFPPSPVVGTNPFPPTNFGRTNLFTGTNRFLANPPPLVDPVTGLTNTVPPGANLPGETPTLPGTPPTTPGNPPPFEGVPPLPGNPPITPQTPPGLPGNTPGLPGTTPGLPGNPQLTPQTPPGLPGNQPGLVDPGGAPPPGSFTVPGTVPPPQPPPMPPRPVQPAPPKQPLR